MVLESEQVEKPPATVEAELRGFSYMPETKMELNLQFIEGEELERTWKTTRRQRLKEREQKIWDEFVKEQDVLKSVCKDDPYQFLEQLPETCIKELLEIELQKMKKETKEEEEEAKGAESSDRGPQEQQRGGGDSPRRASVSFANDGDDDGGVIHMFEEERSGPDDELLNESQDSPPCTVRDRLGEERGLSPVSAPLSPGKGSSDTLQSPQQEKSSENVTSMIESSIYCAKVREVRMKMNEELAAIIETLEGRDIFNIDPEDLPKISRRSTEFCARFNRIYMYQLQRMIHDVKRNNSSPLPFARHTQFQAQLVRIGALHQKLLQALQIFHKSFEQTAFLNESSGMLRCLLQVTRDASAVCAAVPRPHHVARDLYADDLLASCDKLDESINEYNTKLSSFVNTTNNTNSSRSKRTTRTSSRMKSFTTTKMGSKMTQRSDAESRLSMYSLDTRRTNLNTKSSSSRDNQSGGTCKVGAGKAARAPAPLLKTPRKSPRSSRRPLMRDPQSGRARRKRDSGVDIETMVEAVEACTSSHISREGSPLERSRNTTPRTPRVKETFKTKARITSPKKRSPHRPRGVKPLATIKSDGLAIANSTGMQLNLASKIQSAKESPKPDQSSTRHDTTPRDGDTPRYEKDNIPRYEIRDTSSHRESHENSPRVDARDSSKSQSPRAPRPDVGKSERERNKILNSGPGGRCEVTRIVRQLCGGDGAGGRNERVSGAKNAQLLCISGSSPRQPSTPQLLRILEETIQKKVPKTFFPKPNVAKGPERFRLSFNIPERAADSLFRYRSKFVQHMLTSPMYANCAVGKPWEAVARVSDQLIDELLGAVAQDMQLRDAVCQLYRAETN